MRPVRTGELDTSGRGNLNTADNMALYPLTEREELSSVRIDK